MAIINSSFIPYFFNQMPQLLFFHCSFLRSYYLRAATIRGWCFFPWKACMSNLVTTVRRCQKYTQPLSSAVSCGNESYYTNSPTTSLVTVVRNHSQSCLCATYTSHSYYSRAAFISLRASSCVVTIQWQCLFKEIQYLSLLSHTVSMFSVVFSGKNCVVVYYLMWDV